MRNHAVKPVIAAIRSTEPIEVTTKEFLVQNTENIHSGYHTNETIELFRYRDAFYMTRETTRRGREHTEIIQMDASAILQAAVCSAFDDPIKSMLLERIAR